MPELPVGTITFLFTDIEGSTSLWERHPEEMRTALARHDTLLKDSIEQNDGYIVKTTGDGVLAAFATATDALQAALAAQLALLAEPWTDVAPIKVRMGLHTGAAEWRDGDYFGSSLNRAARIMSTGHGGQTLLSGVTAELCRDALPKDVLLLPLGEHRLKDLARPETIFQMGHPHLPEEFPPLKSLDQFSNNLPQQLTSFIGREKQMSEVKGLLERARLLTLIGSGGAGKTRLSLQVAADLLERYVDGVWLVELASLSDPALVPQEVASVLGLREQPGKSFAQTLTDFLRDKRLLLVLDNCEHVLAACAQLCNSLLRACPGLTILASSREGLGIAGEQTYRVPSLSLPDPKVRLSVEQVSQYEAVRLFIERAVSSKADFVVTNDNAPALAEVCHRLDGIPLAIELAAARVRSLSVEEIHIRLDNRFRLLTGGSKAALPRQQTLRALIDWSYDLLTEPEKLLLSRLSVFAGGWTLGVAEAVCAGESETGAVIEDWEVFDLLTSLVDKSLVVTETQEKATRYRLLETVRQYARERLEARGEAEAVWGRHRDYFLALAEEAEPKLMGADQGQWLATLDVEHDNLRQAMSFCLEEAKGAEAGLRLGTNLLLFWDTRGYWTEGRAFLEVVLQRVDGPQVKPVRAGAIGVAGKLALRQGDYALAHALLEESLVIFRELEDQPGIANSLSYLGTVDYKRGDYAAARTLFEESLVIFRELGDKQGIAMGLNDLGNVASDQADYAKARALFEESLMLQRELGDRRGISVSLINLGRVASRQGDFAQARTLLEESLMLFRELGNRPNIATCLMNLGVVAGRQEDHALSRTLFEESLAIHRQLGNKEGIATCLMNLGVVARIQGDYVAARALCEESLAIHRQLGDKQGIAMTLNSLANLACENQGDYAKARILLEESLMHLRNLGNRRFIAASLDDFAQLAYRQQYHERAARLWGAATALWEQIGVPRPPAEEETYKQQMQEARPALGEEAFTVAFEEGRALTLEQAIDYALGEQ